MKKRPNYSDENTTDAVNVVIEQGYRDPEAARNPGMSESALRRWENLHQKDNTDPPKKLAGMVTVQAENKPLKKPVTRLERERDSLKKAAAFLCQRVCVRDEFIREQEQGLAGDVIMRSEASEPQWLL